MTASLPDCTTHIGNTRHISQSVFLKTKLDELWLFTAVSCTKITYIWKSLVKVNTVSITGDSIFLTQCVSGSWSVTWCDWEEAGPLLWLKGTDSDYWWISWMHWILGCIVLRCNICIWFWGRIAWQKLLIVTQRITISEQQLWWNRPWQTQLTSGADRYCSVN